MEVGLSAGHIMLDGDPAPPPEKRGQSLQFLAHARCGQTAGWIKVPLSTKVGLGPGDIVLDGDPAPPQKGHSPQFSVHVWPNGCIDQDATWYGRRPRPRRRCVTWGHGPSQFSAHVYCDQTATCIRIPLGTVVGLGPGDIALDGDQLTQKGGTAPRPQFSAHVYCGQTAGTSVYHLVRR